MWLSRFALHRIANVDARSITKVRAEDRARAISTIVSAFTNDPVERWLFPEPERYQTYFGEFVAAFAGGRGDQQAIWALGDFHATAIWLAPGARIDEASVVAVLTDGVASEQHANLFPVWSRWIEPIRAWSIGICRGWALR